MSKFKSLRTIFLTSALTIGISVITSQNVFAATLNTKVYIVKSGDCLNSIAQKYGESLNTLRRSNIKCNDTIFPGQVLNVPGATNSAMQQPIHLDNKNASSTIATYKTKYTMNATAYTGGDLTAMGLKPVRNSSGTSTIAVDPSVIPLGTKVYISGYGNAICSDTGGSIKGDIIDLYMNSEAESLNWGRKTVTLYIR